MPVDQDAVKARLAARRNAIHDSQVKVGNDTLQADTLAAPLSHSSPGLHGPGKPKPSRKPFDPFRYPAESTIALRWDGVQWVGVLTAIIRDTRHTFQANAANYHAIGNRLGKLYRIELAKQ